MKTTLAIITGLLLTTVAMSQQIFIPGYDKEPDDEPQRLFPPYETVHSGRELPRTATFSYADEESLPVTAGPVNSTYIQILDEPQATDEGSRIIYTYKYRMPFAWVGRQVFLRLEGSDNPYHVTVNGEAAGNNQSSRSSAEFDITSLTNEGVNTLSIEVEKQPAAGVLTTNTGAGKITGPVIVHSQPRIRVRDYVAEANFAGEEPSLQLGIIIKTGMLNARRIRLNYSLLDHNGQTVATGHREAEVGLKEEDTVRFFTPAKDLLPWTYETPNVYELVIKNYYENRLTEVVRYKTGLRNLQVKNNALYTDNYQLPIAIYVLNNFPAGDQLTHTLRDIRNNGFNMVVANGYPASTRFMEVCDSLGLYTILQADVNTSRSGESRAVGGNPSNDPRWAASFIDRAVTLHGASRSYPSTAMFSIARTSANGYNLYESYRALKAIEPNRPVIYPEAGTEWNSDAEEPGPSRLEPLHERLIIAPFTPEQAFPAAGQAYSQMTVDPTGECKIKNNSHVTPLKGTVNYTVKQGMKKLAEGTLPVTVEPGGEQTLQIPVPETAKIKKLKFETTLETNFDRFPIP